MGFGSTRLKKTIEINDAVVQAYKWIFQTQPVLHPIDYVPAWTAAPACLAKRNENAMVVNPFWGHGLFSKARRAISRAHRNSPAPLTALLFSNSLMISSAIIIPTTWVV